MTKVEVRMITCSARVADGTTSATERRLAAAGLEHLGGTCVRHVDGTGGSPEERMVYNYRVALRGFLDGNADVALVLEDDLWFAKRFGQLAREWIEEINLQGREVWLGSLYNPGIECAYTQMQRVTKADPTCVYGSQAFCFSRPAAQYVFDHWTDAVGLQDLKAAALVARGGGSIYYHRPSIVDHAPAVRSSRTGAPEIHKAKDFVVWYGTEAYEKLILIPTGGWSHIPGWYDWHPWIKQRIAELPHGSAIVELGVFCGKSTVATASEIVRQNKDIRFLAVDNWRAEHGSWHYAPPGFDLEGDVRARLRALGLHEVVELVTADTAASAGILDVEPDVVFFDADHSEAGLRAELEAWWPKLKSGGYFAGHDIHTYASVGAAVKAFADGRGVRWKTLHPLNTWELRKP